MIFINDIFTIDFVTPVVTPAILYWDETPENTTRFKIGSDPSVVTKNFSV